MLARLLMTLDTCLALTSNSPAIALTRAPLVMAFVLELAFAAFMVFGGNILQTGSGKCWRTLGQNARGGREVARLG